MTTMSAMTAMSVLDRPVVGAPSYAPVAAAAWRRGRAFDGTTISIAINAQAAKHATPTDPPRDASV